MMGINLIKKKESGLCGISRSYGSDLCIALSLDTIVHFFRLTGSSLRVAEMLFTLSKNTLLLML